ncbi:MAG: ribosomal-processing cysteine protease Prp [Bacteroides sp.]
MTQAKVKIGCGDHLLTLEGHATGSETVCAAISAIVYALEGYLENAGAHIYAILENETASGNVHLHYLGDESVTAAWEMAYIGLAQIQLQYPDLLSVRLQEEKIF